MSACLKKYSGCILRCTSDRNVTIMATKQTQYSSKKIYLIHKANLLAWFCEQKSRKEVCQYLLQACQGLTSAMQEEKMQPYKKGWFCGKRFFFFPLFHQVIPTFILISLMNSELPGLPDYRYGRQLRVHHTVEQRSGQVCGMNDQCLPSVVVPSNMNYTCFKISTLEMKSFQWMLRMQHQWNSSQSQVISDGSLVISC